MDHPDSREKDESSDEALLRRVTRGFRGHYAWVLGSLLTILAIYPFVGDEGWLSWLLDLAFVAVILSCFLVSLGRRGWHYVLIIAVALEGANLVARIFQLTAIESPGRLLRILVLIAAMVVVLRDVLRARRVTMDTVLAAASVYLLMAFVWTSIYVALETVHPGSFKLAPTGGPGDMTEAAQLVYFSLITLTTVGYGDITPASPQASMLAALEGLIGQLFVAIILARLVAMELSGRRKRNRDDDP